MQIFAAIIASVSLIVSSWLGIHSVQTNTPNLTVGANSTISGLTAKTSLAGGDLIPIVDNSVSPATTKQITVTNASTSFKTFNDLTYAPIAGGSAITTVGTIASGVWNGTTVTVPYGGTGSTTLSSNQVLLGNGTGNVKVVSGFGNSGDILTSGGVGTPPTWTTGISSGANVVWTGTHSFAASTATPITLNGNTYAFPTTRGASSTVLMESGTGSLSWQRPDWILLASTTLSAAIATTTLSGIATSTDLHIVVETPTSVTNAQLTIQFNGDTGTNYSGGTSIYPAATVTYVSSKDIIIAPNPSGSANSFYYSVFDVSNTLGRPKMLVLKTNSSYTDASSIAQLIVGWATWYNTTQIINSISLGCSSNCAIGTRISVYGSSQ